MNQTLDDDETELLQGEVEIMNTEDIIAVGHYKEEEVVIHWNIVFEKKQSFFQYGRILIAFNSEVVPETAISKVNGTGLAYTNKMAETLETQKINEKLWYVGEKFDMASQNGSLSFEIQKDLIDDLSQIPVEISFDAYNTLQTAPESADFDSEKNQRLLSRMLGSTSSKNMITPALGPGAYSDPYAYLPNKFQQNRYPSLTTNNFTRRTGTGTYPYANAAYGGAKGSAYSGSTLIGDSNYLIGGANWRNFDYQRDYGTGAGQAPTIQLWGGTRNFENSYLNYDGAFIKKWIEPVANTGTEQDKTTTYNVYLDVIGGSIPLKKKLDIVLVLDKSNSMTVVGSDGITRDQALRNAVSNLVNNIYSDPSLDVRMGMVSFYSESSGGTQNPANRDLIRSNENWDGLTADKSLLLNSTRNQALYAAPNGGTPTVLGLKKGYEMLYWDSPEREKVLILISDGTPTFHFEGVQNSNGSDYNGYGYYGYDIGNTLFKNYEPNYTGRDLSNASVQSNFKANLKYPTNFTRPYGSYIRGEVQDGDHKPTHWAGFGGQQYFSASIEPGAYNTVAYHHWLKNVKNNGKYKNTNVFTLGMGVNPAIGTTDYLKVQNAVGTNVLKNIADKKADGLTPEYYDTNSQNELLRSLQDIIGSVSSKTLVNGSIVDDLGDHVTLKSSPAAEYFYVPVNNSGPRPYMQPVTWNSSLHGQIPAVSTSLAGKRINVNNITLGTSEMIRIRYQVQLNTHDKKFYTANTQAYLTTPSLSGNMYFPSPSIRYFTEETVAESEYCVLKTDQEGTPLNGVVFRLNMLGGGGGEYYAISGNPADPLKPKNGEANFYELNRIDPNSGQYILDYTKPFKLMTGRAYQLIEIAGPPGYQMNKDILLIHNIMNDWQIGTVGTTTSLQENVPWTDATGKITVLYTGGKIKITYVNEKFPIDLTLKKKDDSGNDLSGASFSIFIERNGQWEIYTPGLTAAPPGGSIFFSNNIKPGKYKIEETLAPAGYKKLTGHIILEVREEADASNTATARYYPYPDTEPAIYEDLGTEIEVSEVNQKITIKMEIKNEELGSLPLLETGGGGRQIYFMSAFGVSLCTFIIWCLYRYCHKRRRR